MKIFLISYVDMRSGSNTTCIAYPREIGRTVNSVLGIT